MVGVVFETTHVHVISATSPLSCLVLLKTRRACGPSWTAKLSSLGWAGMSYSEAHRPTVGAQSHLPTG